MEELMRIRDIVFETVDFHQDVEIEFYETDGVFVDYDGEKARIGANSKPGYGRGCFLLAMNLSEGKKDFSICDKAHAEGCGMTLDCSRNGVVTVEAAKKYMNHMLSLGLNVLILYTEDTFEIKGRPRFGYLRGRYTHEELREIVSYGEMLGIELIPSIQTLGHLSCYLKWAYTCNSPYNFDTGERINEFCNTRDTLLIDCDETYRFIEDEVRTCKEVFSSEQIYINMDEAHDAFMGRFLQKNGLQPHFEVMVRHLSRVVKICEKYDLKPIMDSDMFFRSFNDNKYYDPTVVFPEKLKKSMPDVDLIYWDYALRTDEFFKGMFNKHAELGRPVHYWACFGTFSSPLPSIDSAWLIARSSMKSVMDCNAKTVMSSHWGDDGAAANYFMALPMLPILSEYFYKGKDCTDDEILRAAEYLTKIPKDKIMSLGSADCIVDQEKFLRMDARRLLYGDILFDLSCDLAYCDAIMEKYGKFAEDMKQMMAVGDKNYDFYYYAWLVYEIGIKKAELRKHLQRAYKENDRAFLQSVVDEKLPYLAELISKLYESHRKQWLTTFKPYGFDVHCIRYGGMIARINEIKGILSEYLAGELSYIEELEPERIPIGFTSAFYKTYVTPTHIF